MLCLLLQPSPYEKGLEHYTRREFPQAIEALQTALKADPKREPEIAASPQDARRAVT